MHAYTLAGTEAQDVEAFVDGLLSDEDSKVRPPFMCLYFINLCQHDGREWGRKWKGL
jgi:hypothetical protein